MVSKVKQDYVIVEDLHSSGNLGEYFYQQEIPYQIGSVSPTVNGRLAEIMLTEIIYRVSLTEEELLAVCLIFPGLKVNKKFSHVR